MKSSVRNTEWLRVVRHF